MVEVDMPKFRTGEGRNRPIGGNVANTPFTSAFRNVMLEAGFDSQLSLARALNDKVDRNRSVSYWLTARNFPSPEDVGNLIVIFDKRGIQSNNEKLDTFLNVYGDSLREKEVKKLENKFEQARRNRKTVNTPVGKWIEKFCDRQRIYLGGFFRQIEYENVSSNRGNLSLPTLLGIEEGIRSTYGKKQSDSFHNAIEREIKEKEKKGKKVREYSDYGMKKRQRESEVPLYNGQQAANIIGSNRETIRIGRMRHGWNDHLLTIEEVNILRDDFRNNQDARKGRPRKIVPTEVQIYPLAS